jgi:hypothetical protein
LLASTEQAVGTVLGRWRLVSRLSEETRGRDAQRRGNLGNDGQGRIAFTALDVAQVAPVYLCEMRQVFLRPVPLETQVANIGPKQANECFLIHGALL